MKMTDRDYLCRLLYTDIMFGNAFPVEKYKEMTVPEVEKSIIEIRNKSETISTGEIYEKIVVPDPQMIYQFTLFLGKTSTKDHIPAGHIVIDSFHRMLNDVHLLLLG